MDESKSYPGLFSHALPPKPLNTSHTRQPITVQGAQYRRRAINWADNAQVEDRMNEYIQLEEENRRLKNELEYIHKLQSANRKLLEEVHVTSELLRAAVLEFRSEQKALDREFLQETRF
jgi:hypothetical protein